MSFGGGMGAGIAIGLGTGKKQASQGLKTYMQENGLVVHDPQGHEIEIDIVLQNALGGASCCSGSARSQKRLVGLLLAGLAAFLVAGLTWALTR